MEVISENTIDNEKSMMENYKVQYKEEKNWQLVGKMPRHLKIDYA